MPQALSLHLLTSVKSQTESTRQTPIATGTESKPRARLQYYGVLK